MNLSVVEQIAKAVLYEGYMLYPYRPSSVKNKQRWNFGVLYPQSYSEAQSGSDACMSQTECLVHADVDHRDADCRIEIRVRFLHLISRTLGKRKTPVAEQQDAEPEFQPVERLQVGQQVLQPWQEAEEREFVLSFSRGDLLAATTHPFIFPAAKRQEAVRDDGGMITGLIIRENETVAGVVEISAEQIGKESLLKLMVRVRNFTEFENSEQTSRDQALMHSLLSAHVVLGVSGGEFISLLEPPDDVRDLAASCKNIGTWPVLVGDAGGERDTILSSPIILYDYPQIAPESAGDLFDGTEIDEILSLRIMTLTDDEKREMRESDARAREILERTETLPADQLMKLHGVMRNLRTFEEEAS
jgi:hydrogenase maturation protease